MSTKYKIRNREALHFISFATVEWIDVFTRPDVAFEAYNPVDGEDAVYHQYDYDNNRRLIEVRAGDNPGELPLQAKYYYYLHGPLKRVELGGNKQGIDYVYTIQGWLKSINHPEGSRDPGRDGLTGVHAGFEKDLFAMTLEYFNGDYTRAGTNINSVNAGQEYFNGNIRNITWRTGAEKYGAEPVMYAYAYDDKYQLKGAEFGSPDFNTSTFTASLDGEYKVNNLEYDANGNILGLKRYDGPDFNGIARPLHDFTDAYRYDIANTNKLTSITGYTAYEYNNIGQLVTETPVDGDIRKMLYDVTGKVTSVTNDAGEEKVTFTYDDRGFRLMKKNHESGMETWYIRDASGNVLTTYEKRGTADAGLKETMIYGSGRIGMYRHDYLKTDPDVDYITGAEVRNEYEGKDYELLPGGSLTLTEGFTFEANGSGTLQVSTITGDEVMGATQYELTDHLGNVRIGVMDERGAITFSATMEADKEAEEEQYFMNMASRYMDPVFNHTAAGAYSSKLNPVDAGHPYTIGPAITLEVSPGDTVRMKVFAQYITPVTDVNDVVTALASAIAGSFGYVSPVGESATLAAAFTEALSAGAAVPNLDRQGAPKAYIQYIIFNKNMTMAQHGYSMVSHEAMANWQKLELEVPIEENGYIYIYIANESKENVDVYFDDMEVQLIDAPVTNASDYYPFGLAMAGRSYSSEKYRFGYQGQFAEKDEETGWNSFELRMYAPVIGRWMNTDPYGQFYSPYLGMGNNPVIGVDPDGGLYDDIVINTKDNTTNVYNTNNPDRLWIDGQSFGYTGGADGSWKDWGLDNVSFFKNHSLVFNELFGDRLLDSDFVGKLLDNSGSLEMQRELMQAGTRQAINTNGTLIAGITLSIPVTIILGGEFIGGISALSQAGYLPTSLMDIGALYNSINVVGNYYLREGAWYLASRGVPILFSKNAGEAGKEVFIYLTRYHHGKAGRDITINEVGKAIYNTYDIIDKAK